MCEGGKGDGGDKEKIKAIKVTAIDRKQRVYTDGNDMSNRTSTIDTIIVMTA